MELNTPSRKKNKKNRRTYRLVMIAEPLEGAQAKPFQGFGRHGSPDQLSNTSFAWLDTNNSFLTHHATSTEERKCFERGRERKPKQI
jgi:hypothetical protein